LRLRPARGFPPCYLSPDALYYFLRLIASASPRYVPASTRYAPRAGLLLPRRVWA
jgi:hypothetical protein